MNYKTVTYRRVKNLGNYESESLEMSAELDDEQNVGQAVYELRLQVWNQLKLKPIPPKVKTDIKLSDF